MIQTADSKALRRKKIPVSQWILTIVLFLGSFIMIVPFLWMLVTSFDWGARLNITFPPKIWPEEPSIRTYEVAFTNIKMFRYIINSIIVSAGVIVVSSLSALLSGYALSKLRFKGASLVLLLALSTMMIPFEMTMIPQYLLFSKLGLLDNYLAFYLPALNYAFGTFLAKAFIDQLPSSLREAAILDGAGEFTVFGRVYLPLCTPIIATMIILLFLGVWNEMLWPLLVLKNAAKYTIQIGLAMFTYNNGINQQPSIIMAATAVSLIPVVVVYMFLQRYIIESIALSGIKQ
ncbi:MULTISPECIES: carbohydrate ABC transporter permease [unclassified Paenibacillus]|uniref:carbohydrate ABC transporter permease n=1 Tax=unclassified Paenibacillus TaxID=185978 RepID=UPI000B99055B|nr:MULTISPECIES: carbohydrate ABC transporter permease [unclassified Paenibacillus]MBJ9988601.1 carbohydrate ABC transporter permease [Paenibacillus sp. S28]OZB94954.1 ABC transporter permease [Paenibacillus sp. XY044]